jgi:glycosyltransferase involved in cell wall biosynthesis
MLDYFPDCKAIARHSGIRYPNRKPYTHIGLAMAVWNEEKRLPKLLKKCRPYFGKIAISVQESTDRTYDIALRYADIVSSDERKGYGDATYGLVAEKLSTPWVFKLDADEFPSDDLLDSLSHATWVSELHELDGIWIPFHSWVEGNEYKEQHSHLRLYRKRYTWPLMLHSRPDVPDKRSMLWRHGHINHVRSLDEMMQDYLRYWDVGRGNPGWEDHNRLMMHNACVASAARRGWRHVRSYPWWPRVEAIAFEKEKPWL